VYRQATTDGRSIGVPVSAEAEAGLAGVQSTAIVGQPEFIRVTSSRY
jgi:hypothetical protein